MGTRFPWQRCAWSNRRMAEVGLSMDEHHQHENGEHGFARVHEFDARSTEHGANGKEPRQDGDQDGDQDRNQGRVGTFDAKAEELGKNVEELGRKIEALGQFVAGGRYVQAWQRQVADFYGMRLRKNVEFGRRFVEVEDIADLMGLQREYLRDIVLDYASSFYQMAGFGLRGPRQTAERLDR